MLSDFTDHIPQATTDPDDTAILLCSCGWESHSGGGGDWWDHLETTLTPHAVVSVPDHVVATPEVVAMSGALRSISPWDGDDAFDDVWSKEAELTVAHLSMKGWMLVRRVEFEKLRAENALWVPNVALADRDRGGGGVEEVIEDLWEAAYKRQHPQGTDIAPLPSANRSLMGPKP